jgi:RNA polymerase sigma-70 factor (ECF subfamily)
MEGKFEQDSKAVVAAVRAAKAGSAPEGRELLARRGARLALRTASVLTASRSVADEVSQDVAIEVLRSIGSLRDPEAFDAWVHRITARRCSKLLRTRGLRDRNELPLALRTPEPAVSGIADEELVALRSSLAAALAELSPRQRLALALRYIHDLSDEQIATALGCKVGTVHALLSRARSRLRSSDALVPFAPTKEVPNASGL